MSGDDDRDGGARAPGGPDRAATAPQASARAARLGAALRANLARRKVRSRAAPGPSGAPSGTADDLAGPSGTTEPKDD